MHRYLDAYAHTINIYLLNFWYEWNEFGYGESWILSMNQTKEDKKVKFWYEYGDFEVQFNSMKNEF